MSIPGDAVSIPPSHGFRSLGCRSLGVRGFDPADTKDRFLRTGVSIPEFPSKLTSKLLSKLTSKLPSKLTSKLPIENTFFALTSSDRISRCHYD